jgi:hypothetical protein
MKVVAASAASNGTPIPTPAPTISTVENPLVDPLEVFELDATNVLVGLMRLCCAFPFSTWSGRNTIVFTPSIVKLELLQLWLKRLQTKVFSKGSQGCKTTPPSVTTGVSLATDYSHSVH